MTDSAAPGEAATTAMREICICADDFGLAPGVNAAVIDLAERGRISATSGMVRRSAWSSGARALRAIAPAQLDVGLHLDFTRPASVDGPEPGLARLLARAYTRTLSAAGLMADIREQLTRFEDAMGRQPAFVDGHRHVHQFPVLRELLLEEIARRYAASLPWVRSTAPGGALRREGLKARVIHALGGPALQRRARALGIPHSRGLLGVYDFGGSADAYRARLHGWLRTARTGDVLMCHPAAALFADPHAAARVQEYAVLGATDFPWHGDAGSVVRPATLTELLQCNSGMPPWRIGAERPHEE